MSTTQQIDFQELVRNHVIESNPLADIAIGSINKIIQNSTLSREEKLRNIIEFNLSFSIIYHCLLSSRNGGKIQEIDYIFMLLQLTNWYKVNSVAA
ncbi:MAG: hypothetical protein GPJ54_07295 [Candidatus Heimdallarchaeota archaeon]|nr:hypothetical protein [Candidatus Heimdallarchaeota archaeon]